MKSVQTKIREAITSWQGDPVIYSYNDGICESICEVVKDTLGQDADVCIRLAEGWLIDVYHEFSGDDIFPVPHPDFPDDAYGAYISGEGHWEGEYGKSRQRLLELVVKVDFSVTVDDDGVMIVIGEED